MRDKKTWEDSGFYSIIEKFFLNPQMIRADEGREKAGG